jgi:hypothetical protein
VDEVRRWAVIAWPLGQQAAAAAVADRGAGGRPRQGQHDPVERSVVTERERGERLDQLFVTTSQENVDTGEDPLAGSLFRADVGVNGAPVRLFAGDAAATGAWGGSPARAPSTATGESSCLDIVPGVRHYVCLRSRS